MTRLLFLRRSELVELLTLERTIEAVERAFRAHALGSARLFPVVREELPQHACVYGVKSGYMNGDAPVLGLKVAGFWPANRAAGLPAHQALVVLTDPDSGVPTAVMDANHITMIRTSAVGAIAARLLARPDSRAAAIIGGGVQGQGQAEALLHVLPGLEQIAVYDALPEARRAFLEAMQGRCPGLVEADSVEEAVFAADVVVTATPSRQPLVKEQWVAAGVHLSAIGADTRGKQELDTAILRRATLVVDDFSQARTLGETQHAVDAGWLSDANRPPELGELLVGRRPGRTRADEVTVFDATGLALQDLVAADLAYRLAKEQGRGQWLELD
jgi:ornithine cyclodeaminase